MWLSGEASGKSRRSLEDRGIEVQEQVFKRHPERIDIAEVLTSERALDPSEDEAANQHEEPEPDEKGGNGFWKGIRSKLVVGDEAEARK